ncbi:hypothetical protein H8H50_14320 [Staphylococcus aureus]|nr:hypothetical protein [Staphylococcus aureus]MBD1607897.1 hypothetical protein [Staphylococcus aureus]MBX8124127.1 hypothetical protein [Staphylococcus aureus]MBX8132434.1 hypothetical protein [Staphylococcus aureus]MBX8137956.1 hypothetical protein [Staphylococcus aureus]MBX8140718.1 hypothetical protein [Staphylococcus aureus]
MYFKNSSLNYIPTTFGGEPKEETLFYKVSNTLCYVNNS